LEGRPVGGDLHHGYVDLPLQPRIPKLGAFGSLDPQEVQEQDVVSASSLPPHRVLSGV